RNNRVQQFNKMIAPSTADSILSLRSSISGLPAITLPIQNLKYQFLIDAAKKNISEGYIGKQILLVDIKADAYGLIEKKDIADAIFLSKAVAGSVDELEVDRIADSLI